MSVFSLHPDPANASGPLSSSRDAPQNVLDEIDFYESGAKFMLSQPERVRVSACPFVCNHHVCLYISVSASFSVPMSV